jgi:hypothetical protein
MDFTVDPPNQLPGPALVYFHRTRSMPPPKVKKNGSPVNSDNASDVAADQALERASPPRSGALHIVRILPVVRLLKYRGLVV